MTSKVTLRLEVSDVYGKPIAEKIDIILRHRVLSDFKRVSVGTEPRRLTSRDSSVTHKARISWMWIRRRTRQSVASLI